MKNPKASVVIPVYNGEKTLKQCLASVLNQTYKNYEVIVVDNNSTDKTKEIIEEFQKKDKSKKIRYFFEPKQGRGAARYNGGKNAKGEIILMTDSDCIVSKNWIKEMTEPIIKGKQVAVQGIKKPVIINYWTEHAQKEREKLIKKRIRENINNLVNTANFAIKNSVLREVGHINPDLIYCEDEELAIKLRIKNYKIFLSSISVLHNSPMCVSSLFQKKFKYGEWNSKIKNIYKSEKGIFQDESMINHLMHIKGLIFELLTLNKDFAYDFIVGVAWRMGLFVGWLEKYIRLWGLPHSLLRKL